MSPKAALLLLSSVIVLAVGAGCGAHTPTDAPAAWWFDVEPGPLNAVTPIGPAAGTPVLAAASGTTPAGLDGERLGILSFNMKHKDKPDQLAVVAQRLGGDLSRLPDFILCQEVLFQRARRKGQRNTAAVLADELGYFCEGTKRTSDREGVAIISRYPFVHYDWKHLKARTSTFLLGFRRVSVMGEFLVPEVGRVRVVSVHFAYLGFEHHVRRKQLTETLEWIAEREREVPANLTILGGDFNMQPHWSELAPMWDTEISGNLKYRDWNGAEPTRGPQGNPNARIDYIFVAASGCDLRMLGEKLLFGERLPRASGSGEFWLSDHLLVLHEYAVGGRATLTAAATP
ncbi:MAG: endonuclease/exonuclease/phosphatase family protein [Planctomycetota bacterium]|jgi:endonuclease/exonuclease/phosphatase family metal-dependent hydrolase